MSVDFSNPMMTNCLSLKELMLANDSDQLFLAVIDQQGIIHHANERMSRKFHLNNKGDSFFHLIHPVHTNRFRNLINDVADVSDGRSVELYLRNGRIHPMKWEVFPVAVNSSKPNFYFLKGFKIIDGVRLDKFNRLSKMNQEVGLDGPVGIMFHDSNGDLIAMNQQAVDMFGQTMETLYQYENIRDLWNNEWAITNEDDIPLLFDETTFRKTFVTQRPEKQIIKFKASDGRMKWILFHSHVLPSDHPEGEIFSVTNVIDITDERNLIKSLSESESLYASFFKQMPGISWIVNEDERLLFASESFFNQYSLNRIDSLNEKLVELVPPSVSNALYEYHMRVFKTGEAQEMMQTLKIADGTKVLYHIRLFLVKSVNGTNLVGGLAIPISDNSKTEIELRKANERLVLLRRATSDAIWEWDMQTGAMVRNDALMEMVGYNSETTGGLAWWLRRIHPEDRNRIGDKIKDATDKHEHSWQDSYRFKCANGDYKFVQDKGFVIYENGLPVKMIGSLTDISNLKELEDALATERLQKQKDVSETAMRVQETERTRIGYELHDNVNQILSSAKLYLDLLKTSDGEQREIKEKSISYVVMAIEEIRKLSKELSIPQLKSDGLINSVDAIISDMKVASSINFDFRHEDKIEQMASGKKITVFRIIQECLKNIISHSKAKNAWIELRVMGNNIFLQIADDGIGFDAKRTSTGIGLGNINERVKFYGGSFVIQTAKGKGCTIRVELPFE